MAKFFRRGISVIRFAPTVAGTSPTRAEITASTDLTPQIADIGGFQLSNAPISVPNLKDIFTPQIQGEDTIADSTLTFNDDNASTTVRAAQTKGSAGYILLFPYGDVPTKRMEIWAVTITGVNDTWSVGTDPAQFVIGYAVSAVPVQNGVVPA